MKSYKYKIHQPGKQVVFKLENHLRGCCELYNAALAERREAWKINRISINYFTQANQLAEIKEIRDDLNLIHSQILQDVLKRADKTFKAFFGRIKRGEKAGFPRFKPVKRFDSFCFPQSGFKLTGNRLTLSKIGTVKLHLSRHMLGKVKTCTIKREVSGWFVIFTVEDSPVWLAQTGKQIGLDAGIESFATLSDGTQIENFKFYERAQKVLRKAQRKVARRKKGSARRRKAVQTLRRVHQKIQNQRNDFAHKCATSLIQEYDLIAIENLNVVGLSKGILSKQVHDAGWNSFFQKLEYKAESAGRKLVKVNPAYTSQDYSDCGNRLKKELSCRVHHCLVCGLRLHRDTNAAINILKSAGGLPVKAQTWSKSSSVALESPPITASV